MMPPSDTDLTPQAATQERPLPWAHGRRLILREFHCGDVEALAAMHRDPRLRALLIDDFPLQLNRIAAAFVERMMARYRQHEGLGIWHAAVRGPRAAFVGWFSLMPMAGRPGEVEIGARLLPSAWGSGLAQEGGEMMLDHAADDLRLSSVWGVCHPDNRSAAALLAAMGFSALGPLPYEGIVASHHRIDLNEWRDVRNTPAVARLRRTLRAIAASRAGTVS